MVISCFLPVLSKQGLRPCTPQKGKSVKEKSVIACLLTTELQLVPNLLNLQNSRWSVRTIKDLDNFLYRKKF